MSIAKTLILSRTVTKLYSDPLNPECLGGYRCPNPSKKIHPEAVMRTVHVFPLISIGFIICYRIK
jgi:hypothetical protein